MHDNSGFLIAWGVLATVLGIAFVVFNSEISEMARNQREQRGNRIGPNTQSPRKIRVAGILALIAGPLVILGAASGVLH
jgi:hypothetical protein